MKDVVNAILDFDPAQISESKNEELAKTYDLIKQVQGVFEALKKEIGAELLTRFSGDGTVFGEYGVTRVKMPNFADVSMETAKTLGAIKNSIDTTALTQMIKKGVSVDGVKFSESVRVTALKNKEEAA